MLPSIFEKHKICSSQTKSPLIVNLSMELRFIQYYQQKNENFAMEGVLLFGVTFPSTML